MSDEEKKSRFAGTYLNMSTHIQLCRQATRLGKHPSDLVEHYIVDGLKRDLEAWEEGNLPKTAQVFNQHQRHMEHKTTMNQLRQMAYDAAIYGDDEYYDTLRSACEIAGVNMVSLLDEVSRYRDRPPEPKDDGTGVASAMAWLSAYVKPHTEYPVNTIVTKGAEAGGYTEYTLKEAKKRLGIVSERRSDCWVWKWPDSTSKAQ